MLKSLFILWIFLLVVVKAPAQNLVPNPGFEDVDSLHCSYITGDIGDPWLEDFIQDWSSPTGGTSDLNSILVPDSCFMNPSQFNIRPRTGNNIAGIYTVEGSGNYREYLQVKLKQPMRAGEFYYAEMYVLRNPAYPLAGNNLGIYFSDKLINESKEFREVLDFTPQVLEEEIVLESQQWQKIAGCFMAETDAEYLLIGNFFTAEETQIVALSDNGDFYAYYFIDDVYVAEVPGLTEDILGDDTTLCAGETLLLNAYMEGASYLWDDLSTEATLLAEVYGTYWVDITLGECTWRDSITISYEPAISLGKDTLLCAGESLRLDAAHPNGVYQWSDGSTTSVLEVKEAGTYWVTVPSAYCLVSDTITVSFITCPGMIPNVFTPGNDEANETFYIENIANRQWQLRIFNRWGKEVYFSDNYQNEWTGEGLSSGVYVYYLYSPALQRSYKGWVHLLRQQTNEQNQ